MNTIEFLHREGPMNSVLMFEMTRNKGKEDERKSIARVVHISISDYNDYKETKSSCRK